MSRVLLVGIAGGSGSGKTTLACRVKQAFGDDVTVIKHDNYYRSHDELTYEERTGLNYDHPDAFETELLVNHLLRLREWQSVTAPVYDYSVHNRSAETQIIVPSDVIIVEGILILQSKELRDLLDIRLFVDTDADVRLARRITRDIKNRGRTVESVVEQYFGTVKPMHEQFVEPSKKYADIIIPEGGKNNVAFDMITDRIKRHLASCAGV